MLKNIENIFLNWNLKWPILSFWEPNIWNSNFKIYAQNKSFYFFNFNEHIAYKKLPLYVFSNLKNRFYFSSFFQFWNFQQFFSLLLHTDFFIIFLMINSHQIFF